MDYQARTHRDLRSRADDEAWKQTTLQLGKKPEDPVHYALKPTLGGGVLVALTSMILGVEPDGLKGFFLIGILGSVYWVLHKVQTVRSREWDLVLERHKGAALHRLRTEIERRED